MFGMCMDALRFTSPLIKRRTQAQPLRAAEVQALVAAEAAAKVKAPQALGAQAVEEATDRPRRFWRRWSCRIAWRRRSSCVEHGDHQCLAGGRSRSEPATQYASPEQPGRAF